MCWAYRVYRVYGGYGCYGGCRVYGGLGFPDSILDGFRDAYLFCFVGGSCSLPECLGGAIWSVPKIMVPFP